MKVKIFLPLTVALLMFPQLAQTLYSPALGDIGRAFAVGPERAGQTLSVYFLASPRLSRSPLSLVVFCWCTYPLFG